MPCWHRPRIPQPHLPHLDVWNHPQVEDHRCSPPRSGYDTGNARCPSVMVEVFEAASADDSTSALDLAAAIVPHRRKGHHHPPSAESFSLARPVHGWQPCTRTPIPRKSTRRVKKGQIGGMLLISLKPTHSRRGESVSTLSVAPADEGGSPPEE